MFFFFKQKTAYEMRISDWSSDLCSSDLIIDRRLNPGGKSLVNRQRFLRRAREMVRGAVRDSLASRKIREVESEGEVSIRPGGVHEPTLRRDSSSGDRDHILPGNRVFRAGDRIKRPPSGEGSGSEAGQGE